MQKKYELSVQFRHLRRICNKSALIVLFCIAFLFMLLNKSNNEILEQTASSANLIINPIIEVLVLPAKTLAQGYNYIRSLRKIDIENKKLKAENSALIIENAKNKAIIVENKILSQMLNFIPPPEAAFISAKVIAEEGDPFAHALIVYIGKNPSVKKGQIAMGAKGVVGRVESVDGQYAKISLLNNLNSKIPIIMEETRTRGILSGENSFMPKIIFTPTNATIMVGETVATSGVGGIFPSGLPVGKVIKSDKKTIVVEPFNNLHNIEYIQIVNYNLHSDESQ